MVHRRRSESALSVGLVYAFLSCARYLSLFRSCHRRQWCHPVCSLLSSRTSRWKKRKTRGPKYIFMGTSCAMVDTNAWQTTKTTTTKKWVHHGENGGMDVVCCCNVIVFEFLFLAQKSQSQSQNDRWRKERDFASHNGQRENVIFCWFYFGRVDRHGQPMPMWEWTLVRFLALSRRGNYEPIHLHCAWLMLPLSTWAPYDAWEDLVSTRLYHVINTNWWNENGSQDPPSSISSLGLLWRITHATDHVHLHCPGNKQKTNRKSCMMDVYASYCATLRPYIFA